MSVFPIVLPRFRAFDVNGDPLSGGLLYAYLAGTTTPRDTFTTRAGTVANANPVVLDANGEADVWLTPGVEYKFVLKNSAGVTQWTSDNVPATQDYALLPDGSVSAPALAFSSDPNTGIYRPGADQLGVAAGGVLVALFTSSQLQLRDGSAAVPSLTFQSDPDSGLFKSAANEVGIAAGGVGVAKVSAAGINMAAATTNPPSTTAFTNVLTPKNFAKAWARVFVASGGAVTLRDAFNVASVAVVGGELQITLATALVSTDTACPVATEIGTASAGLIFNCRIVSTTVIGVNIYNSAGAGAGDGFGTGAGNREVAVVIFGAQ